MPRIAPLTLLLATLPAGLDAQVEVTPVFSTASMPGANVDSCAAWAAPPGEVSLLFVTEKDGDRVQVCDASTGAPYALKPFLGGPLNSSLPGEFNRPNGVWVLYHVPYAGGFTDVLLATDQMNFRIQVFKLPELSYFGQFGTGEVGRGYGLAPYQDGSDYFVFVSDNVPPAAFPGKLKKYRLRPAGAGLGADLLLSFGSSSGNPPLTNVESILVDLPYDRLHVCGDEGGDLNRIFRLTGAYTGTEYGEPQFQFDQEGINLYDLGGRQGYILVSDQWRNGDPNQFEVFDRATLAYRGYFASPEGGALVTSNTDGAYLEQRPLPGFPNGAFYAVNDDHETHAYDWTDIAEARGLEITALDRPFPGRAPGSPGASGAWRSLWFHDGSWWGILPRGNGLALARLEDGTFAAQAALAGSGPVAVQAGGGELVVLIAEAPAVVRRFAYALALRRYQETGETVLAEVAGPHADLAVAIPGGGGALAGWVAWVAGGTLRAAASAAGLAAWDPEGTALGAAAGVTPRLVRSAGATGVLWAEPAGAAFRLHDDEGAPADWSPREEVAPGEILSLAACAAPDGRVIAAASLPGGGGWVRVRHPGGAWSALPLAGGLSDPALVADPARGRLHLVSLAERGAGHRVLERREASLADLLFGAPELACGWPVVDLGTVHFSGEVPAGAHDLVSAALGDDGLGYFSRTLVPGTADAQPPITLQHAPAPGAVDVPEEAVLSFRLSDDRAGVDRSTLRLHVNGVPVTPRVRGVPRNLLVSYQLPPGTGTAVAVRIEAADLAAPPRVMAPFEYGFTLGESPPRFRRGDANGDRSRDLSDAVRILLALFTGTAPLDCLDTGDTDDDGHLNITDPIFLLAHLFQGGGPPPAPGTDCGPDPTADALACEAPAGCG